MFPPLTILPARLVSGRGSIKQILHEGAAFGANGILVHGQSQADVVSKIMAVPQPASNLHAWQHPGGEPTTLQADVLRNFIRKHDANWVAAIGGGSVLDVAKAAAGLACSDHSISFHHDGAALEQPGLPFLAAPTTAGTGSEATPNAVLTNTVNGQKKSIREDSFMARSVVLDPALLAGCPKQVIAHAGLDALTQALEAYISRNATQWTDLLALEAISMMAHGLTDFYLDPAGAAAEIMLNASFMAGMALANARLGIVHGMAHPLGVRMNTPHGQVCAICLPLALAFNRDAMGEKYHLASQAMGGDIIEKTLALSKRMNIDSPFTGHVFHDRDMIVAETLASGSTKANPRTVTEPDVIWFLDRLEAGTP